MTSFSIAYSQRKRRRIRLLANKDNPRLEKKSVFNFSNCCTDHVPRFSHEPYQQGTKRELLQKIGRLAAQLRKGNHVEETVHNEKDIRRDP